MPRSASDRQIRLSIDLAAAEYDSMPRYPELGEQLPGWAHSSGRIFDLEMGGVVYRMTPFARLGRRRAIACEAPLGASFPRSVTRDAIRRAGRISGDVLVFTDAAACGEVWSWEARDGEGPSILHERTRFPGAGGEGRPPGIDELPDDRMRVRNRSVSEVATVVAEALLRTAAGHQPDLLASRGPARRLLVQDPSRYGLEAPLRLGRSWDPLRTAPGVHARQLVHDLVTEPSGPGTLRTVWRATTGLRVLDPSCGTGGWLLSVMDALEAVYVACLERMQLWLDEPSLIRRPRRRDYLRDFRAVLACAYDTRRYASPRVFAREAVVLLNLYGAERGATRVERCRRRLVERIRAPEGMDRLPVEFVKVVHGDPRFGLANRRSVARALAGEVRGGATLRRIVEESEAAARADRLLRDMRLEHGLSGDTMVAGLEELRERLTAIGRELDRLASTRAGITRTAHGAAFRRPRVHRPVHAFSQWYSVMQGGGFHVIRSVAS